MFSIQRSLHFFSKSYPLSFLFLCYPYLVFFSMWFLTFATIYTIIVIVKLLGLFSLFSGHNPNIKELTLKPRSFNKEDDSVANTKVSLTCFII